LRTLCHEKHAELFLPEERKQFKGRIVFRGDDVRDAEGYLAVFSEQGTSASHLEAAKMMDALARLSVDPDDLPDSGDARASQVFGDDIVFDGECDGEDADAIGAYTQAFLGGPLTWITIPKEYWPASWHG